VEYAEHTPLPPLAPHVKCIWTLQGGAARAPSEAAPAPDRILPDGCGEIVLNLADRFRQHDEAGEARLQPEALLVAQLDRHIRIAPTGDVDLVGIRFRPGGLFPFLGLSVDGIVGSALDLGDVSASLRRDLSEAARGRGPLDARVAAVQGVLFRRLDRLPREPDGVVGAVVRRIAAASGAGRVGDLRARLGIGERQLLRRFRREVGLAPKTLAAIVRFQRGVALVPPDGRADWARIAAASGYADQAHLVREFRRFAGIPPTAYLRERTELSAVFEAGDEAAG